MIAGARSDLPELQFERHEETSLDPCGWLVPVARPRPKNVCRWRRGHIIGKLQTVESESAFEDDPFACQISLRRTSDSLVRRIYPSHGVRRSRETFVRDRSRISRLRLAAPCSGCFSVRVQLLRLSQDVQGLGRHVHVPAVRSAHQHSRQPAICRIS